MIPDFLQTGRFFLIDAVFVAKTTIRSLPEFHGARWSAWLRYACRSLAVSFEDIAYGIIPLRSGQVPVFKGDLLFLRFIINDEGRKHLGRLGTALGNTGIHGEFSPRAFELLFWRDILGLTNYAPDISHPELVPITMATLEKEISALFSLDTFTLHFFVPLRLKLPPGSRKGSPGISIFCPPEFFTLPHALDYLSSMIRLPKIPTGAAPFSSGCPSGHEIVSCNLAWHDMRYSQTRQIALGGLVGRVSYRGHLKRELATRLVMGQYFGAGKNPLFGLGYWQIPEIRLYSAIPLDLLNNST